MSGYSLERLHELKGWKRQEGRTTDAVFDIIGKIMATENEIIPFVVKYYDRVWYKVRMFEDIVFSHFHEKPKYYSKYEIGIEGYSSRVKFFSANNYHDMEIIETRFRDILPTYDLD